MRSSIRCLIAIASVLALASVAFVIGLTLPATDVSRNVPPEVSIEPGLKMMSLRCKSKSFSTTTTSPVVVLLVAVRSNAIFTRTL
mgnify:CR=1 FL=1